jgi:lipopolysaccharide/colanic/teichoic acid biosynthesis glycosyltransferase
MTDIVTTVRSRAASRPRREDGEISARVWGLDPNQLLERYWASQRISIVRAGSGARLEPRAELYLLTRDANIVLFNAADVMRRLRWLNPPAMRLRVVDAQHDPYTERAETDSQGRLVRIVRSYSRQTHATTQVWLTSRRQIARAWAAAPNPRQAKAKLIESCGVDRPVGSMVEGHILSPTDPAQVDRFMMILASRWSDPGQLIDGIFQYQAGVWAHERSEIDVSTRFVAPVWLGAGAHADDGRPCVGPVVERDHAESVIPVIPIDWNDLAQGEWRLMPSLGQRPVSRAIKRTFDILFSVAVLLATLWLYPIVMLLILLEDGWPVFFAHRRQTLGGREFPCYKFRTMRRDAEQLKAQLVAANQADGPQFFIERDPRLLRVGTVLRKFQIDELPQFWNVLLGHMSVVGPRPSPDKENQFCPSWREARLSVRPGVTGLWQIRRTRQPQTDFQEWIRYDLEYVQHQSLRLDIWIIMNTLNKVIGR